MWKIYVLVIVTILMFVLAVDSIVNGDYWRFTSELLGGLLAAFVAIGLKSDLKK